MTRNYCKYYNQHQNPIDKSGLCNAPEHIFSKKQNRKTYRQIMLCLKDNKRKKKYEVKRIKETLYVTK